MGKALWTPKAEEDLEKVLYYVAVEQRRPEASRQFAIEFEREANAAASSPKLGARHPLAPIDWRYWKCKRWLIFYRECGDAVEVMRVLDPARDFPALFGG